MTTEKIKYSGSQIKEVVVKDLESILPIVDYKNLTTEAKAQNACEDAYEKILCLIRKVKKIETYT